ncbi:MAG: hypothetical protein ACRC1K_16165 [Planctomycetia bacterium]
MPIPVECEECGVAYRVKDDRAGTTIKCKDCGAPIKVPAAPAADEEPAVKVKKRKKRPSRWTDVVFWLRWGAWIVIGGGIFLYLSWRVFLFVSIVDMVQRDMDIRQLDQVENTAPTGESAVAGAAPSGWTDLSDPSTEPPTAFPADRTLAIGLPQSNPDDVVLFAEHSTRFVAVGGNKKKGKRPRNLGYARGA